MWLVLANDLALRRYLRRSRLALPLELLLAGLVRHSAGSKDQNFLASSTSVSRK